MSWAEGRTTLLSFKPTWSGALLTFLVALLAYPTFTQLVAGWERHPDYAHGWLLLPITGWLFWHSRCWTVLPQPQLWLGSVTMLAGGLVHLAALVAPWPLLDYAGWVLLLRGLALCLRGRLAAWRLMPVLAYGVLMFPLPTSWLNTVAMSLQNIIAHIAEIGLNVIWVCHRRGHLLYLAGLEEPLSVAVECSGVRQMLVFLAMGWLLAFFLNGAWWRKAALVLATIPLAILANVLRVLVLVVLARSMGPESIRGILHDAPLLLTLPLGGVLLWWCYCRLNVVADPAIVDAFATPAGQRRSFNIVVLVTMLTVLIGLQYGLEQHLQQGDMAQPVEHFALDALPWKLGSWQGQPHPEAEMVKKQADFADAVTVRTYSNSQGQAAAVYLVFSSTGRDRLHHPEICLRDAGGATEIKQDRLTVALQAGTQRVAERFRYQRQRQERTIVYYWHYTLLPAGERQSLLQRVHQQQYDRWPGITVQVQTNMADSRGWQAIEATLLPEIDRWLMAQLPAGTVEGTSRLPVRWVP